MPRTTEQNPQQQHRSPYSNAFVEVKQRLSFPYVPIAAVIPTTSDRLGTVIPRLLQSIADGTRLPWEVILAVSGASDPVNFTSPPSLNVTIVRHVERRNAAQNRNSGALHASMPVLAYVDSDDVVGPNWMETIFHVFNTFEGIDVLLHKWFSCKANNAKLPFDEHRNMTLTLPTSEKILIANTIFPNELRSNPYQAMLWFSGPKPVNETNQLFDKGFNHPWWHHGHVTVR